VHHSWKGAVLQLLSSENHVKTALSVRRKLSAVLHAFLIALPTPLNEVYRIDIVHKVG
jgi:hypothetical protein